MAGWQEPVDRGGSPLLPESVAQTGVGPGGASGVGKRIEELKWPLAVYAGTRLALVLLAIICATCFAGRPVQVGSFIARHRQVVPESLSQEFANWDGWWYVHLALRGYPTHASHLQTTLGFFPLYPLVIWLTAHILFCPYVVAGLVVSGIGGLVATVQVQRLTMAWWGPEVSRKAVVLFCLFPGSVIFSMVYPEGLFLPFAAGCMLALTHKRWALAGVLAGLATAIEPDALSLVAMCLAASFVQLRKNGWQDRAARRSLLAPALSPMGALGFAAFLWAWTGTPFASYIAQKYGWHEKTTPFAIPAQLVNLLHEIDVHFHWFSGSGKQAFDLNRVVVLLGTVILLIGVIWLWRVRKTVPVEVLVYVGVMALFMLTSSHVPPSPRLLLADFPVVLVYARRMRGRTWRWAVPLTGISLLVLSGLTFVGNTLRP
jgi:Gpi18-like mannosyltransferase